MVKFSIKKRPVALIAIKVTSEKQAGDASLESLKGHVISAGDVVEAVRSDSCVFLYLRSPYRKDV
jgi:hypothetical protein